VRQRLAQELEIREPMADPFRERLNVFARAG